MLRPLVFIALAFAVLATFLPTADAHSHKRSLYDSNSNVPADMSLFERYVASHLRSRTPSAVTPKLPIARRVASPPAPRAAAEAAVTPSSKFSHWLAAMRQYVPGTLASSPVEKKRAKVAYRSAYLTSKRAGPQRSRLERTQDAREAAAKKRRANAKKIAVPLGHYSRYVERAAQVAAVKPRAVTGPAKPRFVKRESHEDTVSDDWRPATLVPAGKSAATGHRRVKRDSVPAPMTPAPSPALVWNRVAIMSEAQADAEEVKAAAAASIADDEVYTWQAEEAATQGDHEETAVAAPEPVASPERRNAAIEFDERSPVKRMEVRMRRTHSPLE